MNSTDIAGQVNFLAIIFSALVSTFLALVWYADWMFGALLKRHAASAGTPAVNKGLLKVFLLTFACSLIAAFVLCGILYGSEGVKAGLTAAFIAGIGWVATFTAINFIFEKRPFSLFLVHAGFSLLSLLVMGAILGIWK